MQLVRDGEKYIAKTTFTEKDIAKGAGFRWDPENRVWWTNYAENAMKLAAYAEEPLRSELQAMVAERQETLEASRATDAEIDLPAPEGLSYMPFQKAGIAFALARKSVLIGDEMGLGKTIQGVGIINADPTIKHVLVVCPASLKLNWRSELTKWLVRPMSIGIANGGFPDTDIVIVNYDVLKKWSEQLRPRTWDLLIADEAHYAKNGRAQRTMYLLGGKPKGSDEAISPIPATRRAYLTGTPITNRPIELWSLIHSLDPDTWRSWFYYAKRYCNMSSNGYGYDVSGASNLDELQTKLRSTILIRRLKAEVLKELPAKVRQVIELPNDDFKGLIAENQRAEREAEEKLAALRAAVELAKAGTEEEYRTAVEALREGAQVAFEDMARVRHDTALAKAPMVVDHVKTLLDDEEVAKVVIMAHHHDVVDALMDGLAAYSPVRLTGQDSTDARDEAVRRFQNDAGCRVFVGSIRAAGVGLTLTASSTVVFAELDWTPGNMTQAEDRCHRIGQENMVLVQHLVLAESIDARMAKTLVEKQAVIDRALDIDGAELVKEPVLPMVAAATQDVRRSGMDALAALLTQEQIDAIHQGLRILAGFDADHASVWNNVGFSKVDVRIGHSLAEAHHLSPKQAVLGQKLVRKYHRQIPSDLLEAANAVPKGGDAA